MTCLTWSLFLMSDSKLPTSRMKKVDGIKAGVVEEIKSMLTEQQGAAAAEPEVKRKKTGQLFQKSRAAAAQLRAEHLPQMRRLLKWS